MAHEISKNSERSKFLGDFIVVVIIGRGFWESLIDGVVPVSTPQ